MRFLKAVTIAACVGVAIGLVVSLAFGPALADCLYWALGVGLASAFAPLLGGGLYRLASWPIRQSKAAQWTGGIAGFLLSPALFWYLVLLIFGEPTSDGGSIGMLIMMVVTAPALAYLGAAFGSGLGQK